MAKNKDDELAAKDEQIKQLQQQVEAERALRQELLDKNHNRAEWYFEVLWRAARSVRGGGTGIDIRNGLDELKKELGEKRAEELEKKWLGVTA